MSGVYLKTTQNFQHVNVHTHTQQKIKGFADEGTHNGVVNDFSVIQ